MRNVCLHQVQAGRCQICFFIVSFTLSFFSLRVQPRQLFNFSTITSGITSKDATRQYKGRVPGKVISPRRFERAIRKRPNTVRCLAVKSALLGTRHPRKEKEAALQNVIGEPACLCGEITMCHTTGDGTQH